MIEFDDKEFRIALDQALADYAQEAWAGELDRAERIRVAAEQRAPKDTGKGAASIVVAEGGEGDGRYIEVGTDVDYMLYQEFGTSRDSPRPFMRPAIEENST